MVANDNIEDHLEKFVSQEMADDVSSQVFQNSDKFNNGENTSLRVVVPDELNFDPANECCHISSGSVGNFSQGPVNVMNFRDGLLESLSESMIDHCNSKRVAEQFYFCDNISELHHLQSQENNCLQTSNSLSKDAGTQRVTEENFEHALFEVTPRVNDANGGIPSENLERARFEVIPRVDDASGGVPTEQCSLVAGNCEHFVSGSIVEQNSENTVSQTRGGSTVFAAEYGNSSQLDCANEADLSPDESLLAEQLSSVKDMNIEGTLLNQVQETSSVSNSFASNNLTSACQSTGLSDSNCAIWNNSIEIFDDSVPTSLIVDLSVALPGTLLQSANWMVNECPSSVSNSEGIMKPLDKVSNQVNEKVQEVVANGLPADGQLSDCGINDVIGKIKKEEPWLSDDRTCTSDWKEPIPYGLKQCYCPHGYVSPKVGHFHCQECGISSRFRTRMMHHEVVKHRVRHSGVKFFLCSRCSSVFVCASKLRRHVMRHHRQVREGKTDGIQAGSDFELCESECGSLSPMCAKGRCCRQLSASVSREERSLEVTCQHLELQKQKSGEPTPTNLKKFKPSLDQVDGKSVPLPEEYTVTVFTAGKTVTTCHPAYDGPLLPVLLKPTDVCELCGQCFAQNKIQRNHYAWVHRLYLKGISVFQCTPCEYRTIYHSQYEVHIRTERHRIAARKENEQILSPGEALLADDDVCHKNIMRGAKNNKWKPYNFRKNVEKPFMPSESCRVLRSIGREITRDNCSKTDSIVKGNVSRFASQKSKIEVSKCYPYQKINKFFSLTRDSKQRGDCSNFNERFPSKTATNAHVSGHVCKRCCISSLDLHDEIAFNISKQTCVQPELDDGRSSGSTAVVSRDEFNPVIVESYSCVPSTWSNTPSKNELADLPLTEESVGRVKLTKAKLKSNPISFYDSKMRKTEDGRLCSRSVSATPDSPSAQKPIKLINSYKPKLKLTSLYFYDKEMQKTEDNRLSSRSISAMAKGAKFFQNTKDSLSTSVMAQNANPTSTCEDNVPASKSRAQVTVKRSSPRVGKDLTACRDSDNLIVIQVSDEESEPSNSLVFAAFGERRVKTKQIVSSSSADPLRPGSVNSSVSGNACSVADVIELDEDSDDGNVVTGIRGRSTAAVSSESSYSTVARYDKGASLSEFSSEVLFSELKNRGFVKFCHCGIYFLNSDIYNLHRAWHLDGDLLKCNFCGVDNKDWYEFYSHILNHSK